MSEMVSAEEARAVIELHDTLGADDIAAQAPSLARTVIALHAIVEGRATPPTAAELHAHDQRGARWLIRYAMGTSCVDVMAQPDSVAWHVARGAVRWWPLASDGRPCAWPEVQP